MVAIQKSVSINRPGKCHQESVGSFGVFVGVAASPTVSAVTEGWLEFHRESVGVFVGVKVTGHCFLAIRGDSEGGCTVVGASEVGFRKCCIEKQGGTIELNDGRIWRHLDHVVRNAPPPNTAT